MTNELNPKLVLLNPVAWFVFHAKRKQLRTATLANGFAPWWTDTPTAYVRFIRPLMVFAWYRAYVQRILAHEWQHLYARNSDHEADGDMMSHSVWNPKTDIHHVMARSAGWRAKVSREFGL